MLQNAKLLKHVFKSVRRWILHLEARPCSTFNKRPRANVDLKAPKKFNENPSKTLREPWHESELFQI